MSRDVYAPIVSDETMRKLIAKLDDISIGSQIVDNLTTDSASKALSANQGKVLNTTKFDKANIASALGQDTDKVPSNKCVDDALNAIMTESSDRIKFRDGTMIYWGNDSLTPSSVGLNSKRVPISSSFVSISSYSVSAYQENIAGVYVSNVSIAGSQLDAYFYCPSASYTVHYTYMIIGRWK